MKTRMWIPLAGALVLAGALLAGYALLFKPAPQAADAAATAPTALSEPPLQTEAPTATNPPSTAVPTATEPTTAPTAARSLEIAEIQAAVRAAYPAFDPSAFQVRTTESDLATYVDFKYVLDGVDTPYGYTVTVSDGEIAAINPQMPSVEVSRTPKQLTAEQKAAFIEQAKAQFAEEHPNWLLLETEGLQRFDPASGRNEYIVTLWHRVATSAEVRAAMEAADRWSGDAQGGWVYTFDF